jgi:hypothetical protein
LLVLLLREAVPATELLLAAALTGLPALLGVVRTRPSIRITAAIEALLVAATIIAIEPIVVPVMIAVTAVPVLVLGAAAMTFKTLAFVARLVVVAHLRLRLVDLRLHIAVIAIVVAEIFTVARAARHPAIHLGATLGNLLIAEGHDDAVVVFRVLQIVLGQHRVA